MLKALAHDIWCFNWECLIAAVDYAKKNRVVESKTYDALQQQIWALLPGFCNKTVDIVEAFPGIAKILGSAITDRPDLRQEVMASIRKLINQNLDHGESCSNCFLLNTKPTKKLGTFGQKTWRI